MMSDAVFLLDREEKRRKLFAALQPQVLLSQSQVREAFERPMRHRAVWIASTARSTRHLASLQGSRTGDQRLLLLERVEAPRHQLLHALFRFVVALGNGVTLLPAEEIAEVMASPRRDDLFIGGMLDAAAGALVLYRGSLEPLVIPISWFRLAGNPRLNSTDFEVTDFGQTIRFGDIEAAADAILYEFDPQARRRTKQRSRTNDTSFGGALRRLRLQRGLSRDEFKGISSKEIGRIERGEVANPRAKTIAKLAKRLGVTPAEIDSF
jgi:DNA-binding Xre family transcriptional regulator